MRYPATPTLSEEADQLKFICDEDTAVADSPGGTEGASVSGAGAVVPPETLNVATRESTLYPLPPLLVPSASYALEEVTLRSSKNKVLFWVRRAVKPLPAEKAVETYLSRAQPTRSSSF
jgi:hypothetical protein